MLAREDLIKNFRATPEIDSKLLRVSMEAPSGKDAKDIVYLIVETTSTTRRNAAARRPTPSSRWPSSGASATATR
jgi:hypothetical protein